LPNDLCLILWTASSRGMSKAKSVELYVVGVGGGELPPTPAVQQLIRGYDDASC
jgi:hypothetical protein